MGKRIFTITGSNIDGASALYSLGIAYGGEKTTTGTYSSNPYDEYAALHGVSDDETRAQNRGSCYKTTII